MVSKTAAEAATLLDADGYLKSRYQAMIGTKIAGRVEQMRVEEGMKVKKGDTLAVIEHNDLKAMLASREAQAQRTAAELEEERADLWEKERERPASDPALAQTKCHSRGIEKARPGTRRRRRGSRPSKPRVKLMKANIDEIKATIVTMHLYAPFDGTVVEKQGEVGEIISPTAMSSSLGRTAVVTIADSRRWTSRPRSHEANLWRITLGQPASVSVTAIPSKRYRGRLRQVLPMSDRRQRRRQGEGRDPRPRRQAVPRAGRHGSFPAVASRVNSPDAGRSFLFVPTSAVFRDDGHDYVWVIREDNISAQESGRGRVSTTDDLARVESGLKLNDAVVLNPLENTAGIREVFGIDQ